MTPAGTSIDVQNEWEENTKHIYKVTEVLIEVTHILPGYYLLFPPDKQTALAAPQCQTDSKDSHTSGLKVAGDMATFNRALESLTPVYDQFGN